MGDLCSSFQLQLLCSSWLLLFSLSLWLSQQFYSTCLKFKGSFQHQTNKTQPLDTQNKTQSNKTDKQSTGNSVNLNLTLNLNPKTYKPAMVLCYKNLQQCFFKCCEDILADFFFLGAQNGSTGGIGDLLGMSQHKSRNKKYK